MVNITGDEFCNSEKIGMGQSPALYLVSIFVISVAQPGVEIAGDRAV